MDLRRLGAGEWLAAVGGAALLLSLFLAWYDHGTASGELLRSGGGTGAWDAWQSFSVIDVLLALVALAAVALSIVTVLRPPPRVAGAYAALLTLAGAVALALVGFRAIDEPGLPGDVVSVPAGAPLESSIEGGLWLALAALVAIVAGGALVLRRERRSTHGRVDAANRPIATSS